MTRAPVGAIASDGRLAEVAQAALQRGGTAVDACIAAWFAAAGLHAGVLLGPVHMLVSGPGVGAHSYDGSMLQPGKDAPRPRGFRPGEEIPEAARVAVSSSVHAIAAAHAQDGRSSLLELANAGGRLAQSEGAKVRAQLLRRIGEVGALAMRDPAFVRPLLDLGGRPVGGNLTAADFESAAAQVATLPLTSGILLVGREPASHVAALEPVLACACDARGMLAVVHCGHDPSGLLLPSLELAAPRAAAPVRRGVTRVPPGAPLPVPAPIAIAIEASAPWAAIGVESTGDVSFEPLVGAADAGLSIEQLLRAVIDQARARAAVAVVRSPGATGRVHAARVIA
jgi:gamma-glutamyltranspeptidase/glutathione hydrolase